MSSQNRKRRRGLALRRPGFDQLPSTIEPGIDAWIQRRTRTSTSEETGCVDEREKAARPLMSANEGRPSDPLLDVKMIADELYDRSANLDEGWVHALSLRLSAAILNARKALGLPKIPTYG